MAEFNLLGDVETLKKQLGMEDLAVAQQQQAAFNPIAAQLQANIMGLRNATEKHKDPRLKSAEATQAVLKNELQSGASMEEALTNSAQKMLAQGNIQAAQFLIQQAQTAKQKAQEARQLEAEIGRTEEQKEELSLKNRLSRMTEADKVKTAKEERVKIENFNASFTDRQNKLKAETEKLGADTEAVWFKLAKDELLAPAEILTARAQLQIAQNNANWQEMKNHAGVAATLMNAENVLQLAVGREARNSVVQEAVAEIERDGKLSPATIEKLAAVNITPGDKGDNPLALFTAITNGELGGSLQQNRPAKPVTPNDEERQKF